MVDQWLRGLGRLVLPPRCLLCGERGADGLDLCTGCQQELPLNASACARCALPLPQPAAQCGRCLKHPPPWSSACVPLIYADPVDSLLLRYKFGADLAAGALCADLLHAAVGAHAPAVDLIVPVPLHRLRLAERGYDQAWELARLLARRLGLRTEARGLMRVLATAAQTGLDARSRRRNLRRAFRAHPQVRGLRIALVDDVVSTGATARAASAALRAAGAADVVLWAVARAASPAAR